MYSQEFASGYTLPNDLVQFVDALDPERMPDVPDFTVLDYQLTYGSYDQEDRFLEQLDAELEQSKEVYLCDLEAFLASSPDNGLAVNDKDVGRGQSQLPHEYSGTDLKGWLACAHKHLPGAENEVMTAIVAAIVDTYDHQAFEAVIHQTRFEAGAPTYRSRLLIERANSALIDLTQTVADQLRRYAADIEIVEEFASSSLMQAYGTDDALLDIERARARLTPRERTTAVAPDAYDKFVQHVGVVVVGNEHSFRGRDELGWIVRQTPDALTDLMAQAPTLRARLRLGELGAYALATLDASEASARHQMVLDSLEQQAARSMVSYTHFLQPLFKRDGTLSPKQLARLGELITQEPNHWAARMLCALTPVEQLPELLDRRDLVTGPQIAAICVRRLARGGDLERAYEIARRQLGPGPYEQRLNSIYNLLAIYEETGEEAAWKEAEERLLVAQTDQYPIHTLSRYELAARRFVGARQHGDLARADAALADMEVYHAHNERTDVRLESLAATTQLFLDSGELEQAENYAVRLYQERVASPRRGDREDSHVGLLHVMQGYMEAQLPKQAVRLMSTYFTSGRTVDYGFRKALALLTGDTAGALPHLATIRIDATVDLSPN
ncbi:MAG TPA: hypothetical protein VLF91_05670 [Candidatus Saccharimonadales bacterium]|nr:hypothetical protein [Candidatus Saccharimonadales bacterium]